MAETIETLRVDDFEPFIAFLDRAFGVPADESFQQRLPGLYQPIESLVSCNHIIRRDGRIVAGAGIFPMRWQVGDRLLHVAGIGGVAVDPDHRGQGLMSRVMAHVAAVVRERGYDLSFLAGRRQRYQYFGWEKAGTELQFTLNDANIRHAGAPWLDHLEVVSLDGATPAAAARALHDAQFVCCARPADRFADQLRNRRMRPVLGRDEAGEVVSYATLRPDVGLVHEIIGAESEAALRMLAELARAHGTLEILLPATSSPELLRALAGLAERWHVGVSGNWRIHDWPNVVEALLRVRRATTALPTGTVTVGIEQGPRFALTVTEEDVRCEAVDQTPQLSADAMTLMRLLFGPLPPSHVLPLPPAARVLESWCPLPLALPRPDHV